jgi:hypothetical protein
MRTYRITLARDGFLIIETHPDGQRSYIGGFDSEGAARAWVDNYARLRRLNNLPGGHRVLETAEH